MSGRARPAFLGCVVAVVGVALPSSARAAAPDSGQGCYQEEYFDELEPRTGDVPWDGALIFEVSFADGLVDATAVDFVTVTVTNGAGEPVSGDLELAPEGPFVVWRPVAPFVPDDVYLVDYSVDNAGYIGRDDCEFLNYGGQSMFPTVDDVVASPTAPDVVVEDVHTEESIIETLDDMVCCDGAYPYMTPDWMGNLSVTWDEGYCTSRRLWRGLAVEFLATHTVPASSLSQYAFCLIASEGGECIWLGSSGSCGVMKGEPYCLEVESVRIADGMKAGAEPLCFGDDIADELGIQDRDIADELASNCEGQPYVCSHDGEAWDPNDCTPWGDDGTGSDTDTDGGTSATGSSEGGGGDDDGSTGGGEDNTTDGLPGDDGAGGNDESNGAAATTRGCACSMPAQTPVPLMIPAVLLVLLRRRR